MITTIPEKIIYRDVSEGNDILLEVAEDTKFHVLYDGICLDFVISAGFRTDFGSVPSVFRPIISNTGKFNDSYLVHDYCYDKSCTIDMAKELADTILYLNLLEKGMPKWKCLLVYNAVKMFAKSHWRKL
jgi:hypothetical protein